MIDLRHQRPLPRVEHRRDGRITYRLPVILRRGREELPLRSLDVSHHGLFLETDERLPLRHLVRLRLLLPPFHRELGAHGTVIHATSPASTRGRPAGVGVELYALDHAARTVWGQFVARLSQGDFADEDESEEIRFLPPELVG